MNKEITNEVINKIIDDKVNNFALEIIDYINENGNDLTFIYLLIMKRFLDENINTIIEKTSDKEYIEDIKKLVNSLEMDNILIVK